MSEIKTVRHEIDTEYGAYIEGFLLPEKADGSLRPAMVVCPGGGYYKVCRDREGYPIAGIYEQADYQTFVVTYSVSVDQACDGYAVFPRPLTQLMKAVKWVRENAEAFGIDPDKIAISGFSAGGHLAASLGVYWHNQTYLEMAGVTAEDCKPNAMVLVYPVLTTAWPERHGNGDMPDYLVGDMGREKTGEAFWLPANVDAYTAPTFLCHTFMDTAVPVEDSLAFARALAEHDLPFELHITPDGHHGLATGKKDTNEKDYPGFNEWPHLSLIWLDKIFGGMRPDTTKRAHGRYTLEKEV